MRKFVLFTLSLIMIASFGCGKKADNISLENFSPDSTQYVQLKQLSERIPVLNPDTDSVLVSTKDFDIHVSHIMKFFFRSLKQRKTELEKMQDSDIISVLKQIANQETERELFYREANKNKVEVSEDELQETITKIYSNYGGEESFIKFLETQDVTIEQVNKEIKKNLIIDNFVNETAEAKIEIKDEDVNAKLESDKSATVRHILFLTQGKSQIEKSEILKNAEGVLVRAKGGEDFVALAKEFSEDPGSKDKGGLYEKFPRGRMVPAFDEASFTLPIGSISDIVETSYGYHILQIVDREKETRSFDEIKRELLTIESNKIKKDVFTQLLDKLKTEYEYKIIYEGSVNK